MGYDGNPEALASTAWLADHLDDPAVRVVDAPFDLRVDGSTMTMATVAGRDAYGEAHIPGAVFIDVMSDLADPEDPLAILTESRFEALMGRLGISDDTAVVVYDDLGGTGAARLWWALRYYGHDAVKLLDGGLTAWEAEGRPLESEAPEVAPGTFRARVRPQLRVNAEQVSQAIGSDDVCIVDALPEAFFTGEASLFPTHRSGHIPSAHNVPAPANIDPATQVLLPADELALLWQQVAMEPGRRVITYCGGGVFGAFALFVLHLMGHEDAALYDASWMEWGLDPQRPVEVGPRAATGDSE